MYREELDMAEVGECAFHKMVFNSQSNRHALFKKEDNAVTVGIHFRYLEGTLISFEEASKEGKFVGIVTLDVMEKGDLCDVNDDERFQGFECWIKTKTGGRYFQQATKKYYRLGDYLSFRFITDAFRYIGNTANFINVWFYCMKQTQSHMTLKLARQKKKSKASCFADDGCIRRKVLARNPSSNAKIIEASSNKKEKKNIK